MDIRQITGPMGELGKPHDGLIGLEKRDGGWK